MRFHIVSTFANAFGGTELGAIELFRGLAARAEACLWSQGRPDPRLDGVPIRKIGVEQGHHPRGGTLVVVGNFFLPGRWLERAQVERLILSYNTVVGPKLKYRAIERLRGVGPTEIVYASAMVRDAVGVPGKVLASRIDLHRFSPRTRSGDGPFRIGRLSRDKEYKHHPRDAALYLRIAALGAEVRIMGGLCLGARLAAAPGITLLPEGSEPAPRFLLDLDCFLYRTSEAWTEAGGRVVAEAMACGLPVVCGRNGGYAEWIEHGYNGFLFDDDDQALQIVLALKGDEALRRRVGDAARAKAKAMFSSEANREYFDFFLGRQLRPQTPRHRDATD